MEWKVFSVAYATRANGDLAIAVTIGAECNIISEPKMGGQIDAVLNLQVPGQPAIRPQLQIDNKFILFFEPDEWEIVKQAYQVGQNIKMEANKDGVVIKRE